MGALCSVSACDTTVPIAAKGLCWTHYQRRRRFGSEFIKTQRVLKPKKVTRPRLPFWDRIDASGDCWIWTGAQAVAGYGHCTATAQYPTSFVHRRVWMELVGPIPQGLEIDHRCRNRLCCNPDHLEPVTHAENMRRSPVTSHPRWLKHDGPPKLFERERCSRGHDVTLPNAIYRQPNGRTNRCRVCLAESRSRSRMAA